MPENLSYEVFDYGDRLEPGKQIKIEHRISMPRPDIAGLVSQTAEALEKQRGKAPTRNV
ncbi:MAG: hypothetical protein ACLR23_14820 [Clostridia bacterium]